LVLWRAGLRINEALSLTETDLEEQRGSILVRHGKNDRRRQVGMDAWGWTALGPWLAERAALPVGPLFCVIAGPTAGHAWSASAARLQLHQVALEAGVRRRTRQALAAPPNVKAVMAANATGHSVCPKATAVGGTVRVEIVAASYGQRQPDRSPDEAGFG
jgi:integrase